MTDQKRPGAVPARPRAISRRGLLQSAAAFGLASGAGGLLLPGGGGPRFGPRQDEAAERGRACKRAEERDRVLDHPVPPPVHVPAMGCDQRLPGQRVGRKGGEEMRHRGDVGDGGEFGIHRLAQHDLRDHPVLGQAQIARRFGVLLLDHWRPDEVRADHVGADAVPAAFLGDDAGEAEEAVT